MKTTSSYLISDLMQRTEANLRLVLELQKFSENDLKHRPSAGAWSALECIEHLNFYGNYYVPEIEKQIDASLYPATEFFKSGLLGNYFAKSMLPTEGSKKMKTLKSSNPLGKQLDKKEVMDKFIEHQQKLLQLLKKAKKVNLSRTKTGISISNLIKLRLGDTFRVVIYHNQRHLLQAQKALDTIDRTSVNI
ncbi:DinB family protein [Salinimicrobium sp. WS361]|uniref:DinB family protein n=1 Tax=Salinimicrobium sp. WS361 TaxID=3425123 RepID=UPI003D6FBC27